MAIRRCRVKMARQPPGPHGRFRKPFKKFDAIVPADATTGEPGYPLKLQPFYADGNSMKPSRWCQRSRGWITVANWEPKEVSTLLQISHGVVDKDNARQCQDCHVPDGLIDSAELGYTADEVEYPQPSVRQQPVYASRCRSTW